MKVLVLVPARGGSKGLPRKNLKQVAAISLVGHAVRVGRRFLRTARLRGDVVIDTDSAEIASEAARWGADAPFLRPPELARDASPTIDSTLHTLDRLAALGRHYDALVLLQPTSPLRTADDVAHCFSAYDPNCEGVISIVAPDHPPAQALALAADGSINWLWPELSPDRQRQALAPVWRPSGAVYVCSVESLRSRRAFIVAGTTRGVPIAREQSVDVDSAEDLAIAQALVRRRPVQAWPLDARLVAPGETCCVIARVALDASSSSDTLAAGMALAAEGGVEALWLDDALALSDAREVAEITSHVRSQGLAVLQAAPTSRSALAAQSTDPPSAWVLGAKHLADHDLLAGLAVAGEPLLIATDDAGLVELDLALATLAEHGDPPVALLHDARAPSSGLRSALDRTLDLQAAFAKPAGFAAADPHEAIAAAAAGAGLVTLTLDLSDATQLANCGTCIRAIRALDPEPIGQGVQSA